MAKDFNDFLKTVDGIELVKDAGKKVNGTHIKLDDLPSVSAAISLNITVLMLEKYHEWLSKSVE